MVRVDDNRDAVSLGDGADILSTSDGTNDGGLLVLVAQALTGEVGRATIGELDNDWGLDVACGFKCSVDGAER